MDFGKLTYNTFISYFLPGILAVLIITSFFDIFSMITTDKGLTSEIFTIVKDYQAVSILITAILCFLTGIIIDLFSHRLFRFSESKCKNEVYLELVEVFIDQVIDEKLKNVLISKEKSISKPKLRDILKIQKDSNVSKYLQATKRNYLIDMLFYNFASVEVWNRQEWSWSFYEVSRSLILLWWFFIFPIVWFLIYVEKFFIYSLTFFLVTTPLLVFFITVYIWGFFYLKKYNETICKVYHRHRAYIALFQIAYSGESCHLFWFKPATL